MSLELLERALHTREAGLREHVHRVRTHSVELGRRSNWPEEDIEVLALAAELHDVGKIAIPEDVLNKPGRLDGDEWNLMRQHTVIGETLIGLAPGTEEVARLVRCSHERWDGAGYPDGLSGEAIPLGSRIIFIADAYDAITSSRVYQRPVSTEVALEEIRRCAGTQFDPELAEAFADLVQEGPRLTVLS